jgi:hypothetical protein
MDTRKMIDEMKAFCRKNQITSYMFLNRYAKQKRPDWHQVLCAKEGYSELYHFTKQLKSNLN